jgi:hypothetical protein
MLLFFSIGVMLVVAYAYFNQGALTAATMMVNVFLAGLVAFNFFEPLAGELEEMLAGSFLDGLEDSLSLFVLFAATLGGLRVITHNLANTELELPALANQIGAVVFALIAGYLLAGFLMCLVQTLPLGEKFMGFDHQIESNTPPMRRYLPPDRVWLAMMRRASIGPLAQEGAEFDPDGTFELRYARLRRVKE